MTLTRTFPISAAVVFLAVIGGCSRFQDPSRLAKLAATAFVDDPETVNIEIKNYCPASGRTYKDLIVSNLSVEVIQARNELDSDKDGVADSVENLNNSELNISPFKADTNGDGFSDLLMYLAGIDRNQQSRLRCIDTGNSDGSGITYNDPDYGSQFLGLSRCEKEMLHLDPLLFDTDGDGVPDYLELRCGMNPLDPQDARLDTDGDGILNYDECKRHTPVGEMNRVVGIQKLEYRYETSVKLVNGKRCLDFTVSNISVLNGGDKNLIGMFLMDLDGDQKVHLYTAFELLGKGPSGRTIVLEFGPDPLGRFTAK